MLRQFLYLFLIFGAGMLLQLTLVSRISLVNGNADLILVLICGWGLQEKVKYAWIWGLAGGLLVGFISATPWFIYVISYLVAVGLARLFTRRIWQAPLLGMFSLTFLATLFLTMFTYLFRFLSENLLLPFSEVFIQVILPSILLNLGLGIIILPLMRQLASNLYPEEVIT